MGFRGGVEELQHVAKCLGPQLFLYLMSRWSFDQRGLRPRRGTYREILRKPRNWLEKMRGSENILLCESKFLR